MNYELKSIENFDKNDNVYQIDYYKTASEVKPIDFITEEAKNISINKKKNLCENVKRFKAIERLSMLINDIDVAIILEAGIYEFSLVYAKSKNILESLVPSIYNDKLEDIIFNIKDNENYALKKIIANREINLQEIPFMTPQQLNPKEWSEYKRKNELREYKKKNMAATDFFKCYKCGERKCQVTQMQTRSCDEPMTNFITCLVCGNTFKK